MRDLGRLIAPNTLRFERVLEATNVERVWDHLTKTELLEGWLAPGLVEPFVGGRFNLRFDHESKQTGTIRRWEPPTALAFSWHEGDAGPSLVTFELEQSGPNVRLTLTHERLPDGQSADFGAGWHAHLDALIALAQSGVRDTRPEHLRAYHAIRPLYVSSEN